jgi:RNA polymerase sigma-70 factor (ECF subfamily)
MQFQSAENGATSPATRPVDDERSMAQRAVQGDDAAFEWIMRRHNRRLYRLARAVLHDGAEAKDALQDAYLAAYRALKQFRGESTLGTWLARIVLNECMARQRRSRRRDNVVRIMSMESHPEAVNEAVDTREKPDDALARAQMQDLLEHSVNELPEGLRVAFVLRSVEELSVEETAQYLGVTEEAVRTRHFRARSILRERLAKVIDAAERNIYEFGGCECDGIVDSVLARIAGLAASPDDRPD